MSIEDKQCLKMLEAGTKIVNGKYEVPMLRKEMDSRLLNNHEIALRRLRFLPKRFLGNLDLSVKCNEAISTYIKEGYARKMTKEETISTSEKKMVFTTSSSFPSSETRKGAISGCCSLKM